MAQILLQINNSYFSKMALEDFSIPNTREKSRKIQSVSESCRMSIVTKTGKQK